jgi:hypothetical protein
MIRLPDNFSKVIFDSDYVEHRLNTYWQNYSDYNIGAIKGRLLSTKGEYLYGVSELPNTEWYFGTGNLDETSKFTAHLRLEIGYGLPLINFNMSTLGFQFFSEKALQLKLARKMGKQVVDDHIFGSTEIGKKTFKTYMESEWDLDYMTNEYIPQTLYQHLICRLHKFEHQKEKAGAKSGVARNKHSMEEKISLLHYNEADIPLPLHVFRGK